jgi:uncharacterized protein YhaN
MRIRRIKVRNYAGIGEAEVMFPDTGITIIEGDNEVGKTSMVEAVDMILTYLDTSSAGAVKGAMTVGTDIGPEVEVDIAAGPYEFTYRKRWLRDKETVLTVSQPQTDQLVGREAHDRVRQMLDEAVDMELWNALRLDQGKGLSRTSFDIAALGHALDAAAGGDVAGDREDVLFVRIEDEYREYWNKGGKARGDFKAASDELAVARERADTATRHLEELEGATQEVQKLEASAAGLEQTHDDAGETVAQLTEQAEAVTRIQRVVDTSRRDLERAGLVLENAHQERTRRDELVSAVSDAEADVAKRSDDLSNKEPARQVSTAKQEDARLAVEEARDNAKAARDSHDRASRDSAYARQLIEIEQLTERRDRIVAAQELLASADELLETIVIDADLLDEIEDAHLNLAAAKSAAQRSQPTVGVKALERVQISIDGTSTTLGAGEDVNVSVSSKSTVMIGEVAEVTIVAGDDDDLLAAAAVAQTTYDDLCSRADVENFTDARKQTDARVRADRDRTDALKVIKQDLRDLTFEELAGKIDRLTKRTTDYTTSRPAEAVLPSDHDDAQKIERTTSEAATKADEAHQTADSRAKEIGEELKAHEVENASLTAHLQIAQSMLESAGTALADARTTRPDDELKEAETKAEGLVDKARGTVAEAEGQLSDADPDSVEALLSNAKAVLNRSTADLEKNRDRRNELRIELAIQTELGPARNADEAASAFMAAEGRHQRLESRANSARVLHEVFTRHRDAARQRYNQPFGDRIEKLGRIVYGPTFEVHLDQNLSVSQRTLDGTTLDYDRLSTGAREQLGLLARLAVATLVSEDGGAPVIFDDALGWSDPGRLERMGAAISTAADESQIIILTCVPDRYAAVGKATTVRLG